MIANQAEAVDDVDKSHEAGMVLSHNNFPCVYTFRTLACQRLSERKQPVRSRKRQFLVIDAPPKIGVSDSTEQSPARPRAELATS
jgi:hypothetical protein